MPVRWLVTRNHMIVAFLIGTLGAAFPIHAQSDVFDKVIGKDLWKEPASRSEQSRLDELFGEVPMVGFMRPIPWHVWKTISGGQKRYIVLLGQAEAIIPGGSSACVVLFDGTGMRIKTWCFQTGWRGTPDTASLEFSNHLGGELIVLHIVRLINGRNVAKEYFAFRHDQLRFVRMEDDRGGVVQNEYIYPNYEIGVIPEAAGVDEWVGLMESSDKADVLSALMFLGGRHVAEPQRRLLPDPQEGKYASLFLELIGNTRIKDLIGRLSRSDDEWIREAATLATRGPRERLLQ